MSANLQDYWQCRYRENAEDTLSWYEAEPRTSLELIRKLGAGPASWLIDIGGGASHLVDQLLRAGWRDLAVLDISDAAMLRLHSTGFLSASGSLLWLRIDCAS